jgi:hypothetical protein
MRCFQFALLGIVTGALSACLIHCGELDCVTPPTPEGCTVRLTRCRELWSSPNPEAYCRIEITYAGECTALDIVRLRHLGDRVLTSSAS